MPSIRIAPRTQTTGGRSRGRRLSDALLQVVPNLPQVTRPPVSKLARALAKAGVGAWHSERGSHRACSMIPVTSGPAAPGRPNITTGGE